MESKGTDDIVEVQTKKKSSKVASFSSTSPEDSFPFALLQKDYDILASTFGQDQLDDCKDCTSSVASTSDSIVNARLVEICLRLRRLKMHASEE